MTTPPAATYRNALAAGGFGVMYRAFTSKNPPDAVSRLRNDAVPAKLAQLKGGVERIGIARGRLGADAG